MQFGLLKGTVKNSIQIILNSMLYRTSINEPNERKGDFVIRYTAIIHVWHYVCMCVCVGPFSSTLKRGASLSKFE